MIIAVVGSGTMGVGISQMLSQSPSIEKVIWKGSDLAKLDNALQQLDGSLQRLVDKEKITNEQKTDSLKKITITDDFADIAAADTIIEAVAEDMAIKKQVLQAIDSHANQDAIIASNTSSLSITELASCISRPESVVGMHFFNPAPVMKLVEIICSLTTSKQTRDQAFELATLLEKTPVEVEEAPGFIVNRMLIPMINEAIAILAEGVASAEDIDLAMKCGANHPIGPLALADLIGNDVNLSIMETLYNETGDPKYRAHPLLRKMVRAQQLGRKSKKGFYSY